MTTLYFTRHGESVANAADREAAERPKEWDRLSERGWEQARGLGERLREVEPELIVASNMRRAQETAAGIAEVLDLPIETDPDLHEVRQSDAFYASSPDFGNTGTLYWMPDAPPDFAEPGAESFEQIVARVKGVQERLATRAAEQRVVAVSHFGFLHFFLGRILFGEEFAPRHLRPLYQAAHDNTGITVFSHRERWIMDGLDFGGWVLETWNDRAHL